MKAPALISRLAELEAKLDPILFRKRNDDDDDGLGVGTIAALGGGGAVLGGGGYLGHRAIRKAGGYQAVGDEALARLKSAGNVAVEKAKTAGGAASDFVAARKAAAIAGAAEGRAAGEALGQKVGDKFGGYASKAAQHVETGVQAAKTGALGVIKTLKKKLPMLVPHLAKIGLQEQFHGHLIELDEQLDEFLADRQRAKRAKVGTAIVTAAGVPALGLYARGSLARNLAGEAMKPGLRGIAHDVKTGAKAIPGDLQKAGASVKSVLSKLRKSRVVDAFA